MSIQEQLSAVNQRSRTMEFGLLLIAATFTIVFMFTKEFYLSFGTIVVYFFCAFALHYKLAVWREARNLEIYRYADRPIFEIQYYESDNQVYNRAMEHRRKLREAGNEIFLRGLITVEAVYYRDTRFGMANSADEIAEARELFCKEFMNKWGETMSKDNELFITKWIYRQDIGEEIEPPVVETIPSVSEAKMGNFWSFPLLTRLIRGNKEVANG